MSDRRIPTSDQRLAKFLQDLSDRLYRLENGGAIAGVVSFGSQIRIGGVEITIEDAGGGALNVVFTNLQTGATSVINL